MTKAIVWIVRSLGLRNCRVLQVLLGFKGIFTVNEDDQHRVSVYISSMATYFYDLFVPKLKPTEHYSATYLSHVSARNRSKAANRKGESGIRLLVTRRVENMFI